MSEESKLSADGLEVVAWIHHATLDDVKAGFGRYYLAPTKSDEDDTGLCRLTDAQRLLSQLREELAQRDAEYGRMKQAAELMHESTQLLIAERDNLCASVSKIKAYLQRVTDECDALNCLERGRLTDSMAEAEELHDRCFATDELLDEARAALESQQAASVGGVPDVNDLANFIRHTDGNHKMAVGALAERIVDWLKAPSAALSPAGGGVVPDALGRAFITSESGGGSYRVVIKSASLQETQQVHNWLARLNAKPQANHSAQDLNMVEQPQAGAEAFCDGHCSALSPHPDCKLCAEGRHDQGEVRRLREALEKVGNRLEAFIADEMDMPHDSMEVCKAIIDAALTQPPKGEEE